MEKPRNIQLRLLSYGVIAYMTMALAWWSILLFTKNRDAFTAKQESMRIIMVARGEVPPKDDEAFFQSAPYQRLEAQYRSQEYMILGEATVFVISLAIGVWLINRGYNKEMMAAQQRRNFLLSITHELKSPIASIRLVLETFQRRTLPKEKADKLLHNALVEAERLNTLVNDLLLSAKLETAYQPHMEPVDMAQLLEDILEQMEAKYSKANITFNKMTPIDKISGDKMGLTSVILNLLENAVKYSPAQAEIEARISQEGHFITLEIADQGIGIEEKEKNKIFEKFYRIGSEDTRKTKGTGLGLYIVKQLVLAHNGKIDVRNNEPNGTVFSVEIPVGSPSEGS
ncbi:MAG: HAMP domain-containing histidine kinase [Phaeodactylibacter sp.]|nr:HAMP domain-containing histidine kinase [Phaeodactylibacter sp.]MCB9301648.1 HAMP domain-containing histidine kinase [Lewinellaceae bacterium]